MRLLSKFQSNILIFLIFFGRKDLNVIRANQAQCIRYSVKNKWVTTLCSNLQVKANSTRDFVNLY